MNQLDQLTMDLLTNKKHLNKFMCDNQPDKFEKKKERLLKIKKYKQSILNLTDKLICFPDKQINNEIHETFDAFMNACVRHFENMEWNEKEIRHFEGDDDVDDEDVLFPCNKMMTCDTTDTHNNNNNNNNKSLWGKSIFKLPFPRVTEDTPDDESHSVDDV